METKALGFLYTVWRASGIWMLEIIPSCSRCGPKLATKKHWGWRHLSIIDFDLCHLNMGWEKACLSNMGFTALTSLPEAGTFPTIQKNTQTEMSWCLILYNSTTDKVLSQDMERSVSIPTSAWVDLAHNSYLLAQWDRLVRDRYSQHPWRLLKPPKRLWESLPLNS